MISQSVKTRLSWWSCVLLLVLTIGVYFDNRHQVAAARQSFSFWPAWTTNDRLGDRLPQMAVSVIPIDKSPKPDTPLPAVGVNRLDVEATQQALFRRENAIYEKALQVFNAEPVDPGWARTQESLLYAMFTSHSGLVHVKVKTIRCHTSMCRVEVFTSREPHADYFTSVFYNALDNFREGILKEDTSVLRRLEGGVTSAYIARKGYSLRLR